MNRKHSASYLVVAFTSLGAIGCSHNVIRSDHVEACYVDPVKPGVPCDHYIPRGLAYSLPKGQVLLAAFRKAITAADAAKAAADYASAQQAVAEANGKVKDALATQAKNATPTETDAQKTQDKSAVDAAKATLAAAEALTDSSKQNLAVVQSGLPKTQSQVDAAELAVTEATAKRDKDKKTCKQDCGPLIQADQIALDEKQEAVDQMKATMKGKYIETFALTPQSIIPDDTRRYVANLDHSTWRDDTFKLSAVNGLLTSTNTTSTDQSASIISSLASAAVGIVTFIGAGIPLVPEKGLAEKIDEAHKTPPPAPIPEPPTGCNYSFAKAFDPTNSEEVTAVNTLLHAPDTQAHINLHSTFVRRDTPVVSHPIDLLPAPKLAPPKPEPPKFAPPTRIDGLVYRTPAGVGVEVLPYDDPAAKGNCPLQAPVQAQAMQVFVPDTNAEFIAPVEAGAMTASGFVFNFTNGMLADYNITRPSEVAAGAAIPVDIVNKIMTIPTAILKFRLDYSTAETNLANKNAELITAQGSEAIALVKAKSDLDAAEANLITADINDPTARYKALTALVQAKQALADAITAAAKSSGATTQPASSSK